MKYGHTLCFRPVSTSSSMSGTSDALPAHSFARSNLSLLWKPHFFALVYCRHMLLAAALEACLDTTGWTHICARDAITVVRTRSRYAVPRSSCVCSAAGVRRRRASGVRPTRGEAEGKAKELAAGA
eukprot:353245-Chlamydomonas_euryale.AAC.3